MMRMTSLGCAATTIVALAAQPAAAQERLTVFHIPRQALASSLIALGDQGGVSIMAPRALVDGKMAPAVDGRLTLSAALTRLLDGSGLHFQFVGPSAVRVIAAAEGVDAQPQDRPSPVVEEVVVTAQKRSERLQDVPVPVTAVEAGLLLQRNQVRLQDYYSNIPGLNLAGSSDGDAYLSIRGVTTGPGNGNPSVGVTIDDVPYGSSSGLAGGGPAPDLDPSDLARIEVLRGPQGTLYGASSIGGLLKFVTVAPSTTDFSARLEAGGESIRNGEGLGGSVRGAANLPISDTVALRVSGFRRTDPGYVDNVLTGQQGVNSSETKGGHLSLLWRPASNVSVTLAALVQQNRSDGSSDIDRGLGDLQQVNVAGTGASERRVQLYSANVSADFGRFNLTSITGYSRNRLFENLDFSSALGPFTELVFGQRGTPLVNNARTSKWSEELRVSTHLGDRVDALLGAFATSEDSNFDQQILASDPTGGAIVGKWLDAHFPTTYREYAAFGDLTGHLTDSFDVQLGGRLSHNTQTYSEIDVGPYNQILVGLPLTVINPEVKTHDTSFTYLITPRYRLNPDAMIYGRIASGYRAGGPNPMSTVFGVPSHFDPDKTVNYEIGAKGNLLGGAVFFDASVYYIDWRDIQLAVVDPVSFAGYYVNGSRARSQGVELSLASRPVSGLRLGGWIAYDDAELTQDFPANSQFFGSAGQRLPNSPRWSGRLSADERTPLSDQLTLTGGVSATYVGERLGNFASAFGPPDRQVLPSYWQVDLNAGLEFRRYRLNVFVTNVGDVRGVLAGGLGTYNPDAFQYVRPRTVGATLTASF